MFGYSGEIGLNEEKVATTLQQCVQDSQAVVETLGSQMQLILDKLGEEWGTKESITNVDTDIKPGLEKAQQQIALELKAIGDTIRATAIQQATDTKNDFSGLMTIKTADIVSLTNKQQEKLASGYVGAVATLEKDVQQASQKLTDEVNSKLKVLRSNLKDNARIAFLDEGKSVSNKADQYVEAVNTALKTALDSLLNSVVEYTKGVVQYAKDIQTGEWVQVESSKA